MRLKARHERFCRTFVDCMNATSAAKASGYSPRTARNAGYRLMQHPRILARIAEIQSETAEAHCRSVDVLLGKLETIYRRAVDDHHFAAAARAVELQAKLVGLGHSLQSARLRPGRPPQQTAVAAHADCIRGETCEFGPAARRRQPRRQNADEGRSTLDDAEIALPPVPA